MVPASSGRGLERIGACFPCFLHSAREVSALTLDIYDSMIMHHRQLCHNHDVMHHVRRFMDIESMARAAQLSKAWHAVLGPLVARASGLCCSVGVPALRTRRQCLSTEDLITNLSVLRALSERMARKVDAGALPQPLHTRFFKALQRQLVMAAQEGSPFASAIQVTDEWSVMMAILGPDYPYTGGLFFARMTFPDQYPFRPPHICFINAPFHVNWDNSPHPDIDILGNLWSPALKVGYLGTSLASLLSEDANDPCDRLWDGSVTQMFKTDRAQFLRTAHNHTRTTAVMSPARLRQLVPSEVFDEVKQLLTPDTIN